MNYNIYVWKLTAVLGTLRNSAPCTPFIHFFYCVAIHFQLFLKQEQTNVIHLVLRNTSNNPMFGSKAPMEPSIVFGLITGGFESSLRIKTYMNVKAGNELCQA